VWRIEEHRRVDKQLGRAQAEIVKHYEKWKDVARISGPSGLKLIKGFHDEALRGKLEGFRSSRLSLQFRVIYRVVPARQLFQVTHVTPHEYRKVSK
jgi:mRNA-degrading endonuclease YafQ of YafQ-DinJ toxin-antitoxin module